MKSWVSEPGLLFTLIQRNPSRFSEVCENVCRSLSANIAEEQPRGGGKLLPENCFYGAEVPPKKGNFFQDSSFINFFFNGSPTKWLPSQLSNERM